MHINLSNKFIIFIIFLVSLLIVNFIVSPTSTSTTTYNNNNNNNNFKYYSNKKESSLNLFSKPKTTKITNNNNNQQNNKENIDNSIKIDNNNNNSNKMTSKIITKIATGISTSDGAGVKLKRIIGGPINSLDPFLLLDEFKSDKPDDYISGFPSHPHRGFETVTYMIDGVMEHKDHKGNQGLLKPGSVQWMTAGRGIIHSEMPKQTNGRLAGFQLWVNLKKVDKMIEPRYQDIPSKNIPEVTEQDGGKTRVIAGSYKGVTGPVQGIKTEPLYLDVKLSPGTTFSETVPAGHNSFVYVFEGSGRFGPKGNSKEIKTSQIGVFQVHGDRIDVISGDEGARFLLIAAAPINEPIARYGPFVMNTEQEIREAFDDYRAGRF